MRVSSPAFGLPKNRGRVVTIDTLRADHLHCYGHQKIETPVLDQLVQHGVLFENAVASIVKKYARIAALAVDLFSGHSLRAGFVTSAARAGEPERRMMRQTGHKSIELVLRYVRQDNAFTDNGSEQVPL
jgi:integrase